jgi:type II secretory ATPase GspE/PulE/Tfp pilus assembly ATPase PilB-like protein
MECFMPDLLLAVVSGSYISPIKLTIYLLLVFLWLPLVAWVHKDAETLGTKHIFWTAMVFGTWAAGSFVWLLLPVFIIGLLIYLLVAGSAALGYVMHRNALVPEFQRVGTVQHIKGLIVREDRKLDTLKSFIFITANNNEVPTPEPKTPEFFGYKAAYDLFTDALRRRAYDVVLSPTPENYSVVYYVDGTALKQSGITKDQTDYLIRFLKGLANLDINEKRKPQKGKFTIFREQKRIDWEVSTAGSTAGEQARIKLLTQLAITKLDDLGLTTEQLEQLKGLQNASEGVFIVSGTRNSGVTTTFYSLLRRHDAFLNSICTVEKQPASSLLNITQNVFKLSDSGITTFARKLQSVVRLDPDIVGVADCEDAESAQIACAAARDGKLLYVTLDADNVIKALGKWIKLVGDKNAAIAPLLGITSQRLLRKLCDQCRQAYEPNKDLLRKFNIPPEKAKVLYRAGKVIYDKRGKPFPCDTCQETGYLGRMCIFETIMINDQLRSEMKQAKSLADIVPQFRRAKMLYLQEQALRKVIVGITSINEMVRVLASSKDQKAKDEEET